MKTQKHRARSKKNAALIFNLQPAATSLEEGVPGHGLLPRQDLVINGGLEWKNGGGELGVNSGGEGSSGGANSAVERREGGGGGLVAWEGRRRWRDEL